MCSTSTSTRLIAHLNHTKTHLRCRFLFAADVACCEGRESSKGRRFQGIQVKFQLLHRCSLCLQCFVSARLTLALCHNHQARLGTLLHSERRWKRAWRRLMAWRVTSDSLWWEWSQMVKTVLTLKNEKKVKMTVMKWILKNSKNISKAWISMIR